MFKQSHYKRLELSGSVGTGRSRKPGVEPAAHLPILSARQVFGVQFHPESAGRSFGWMSSGVVWVVITSLMLCNCDQPEGLATKSAERHFE